MHLSEKPVVILAGAFEDTFALIKNTDSPAIPATIDKSLEDIVVSSDKIQIKNGLRPEYNFRKLT